MTTSKSNSRASGSQRLLLVKFGAIGDVVMAIPGAYAMYQQGYVVDWLCSPTVAPILGLYKWINVIVVDDQKLLRGSLWQRSAAMLSVWSTLWGRSYSVCATLYYDSRYRLLTFPVRAERKVILSKLDRETRLLPGRHHTDEYARILLGRHDGELPTQLAPIAAQGLPANPLSCVANKRRIVLVPAGAKNAMRDDSLRRWPIDSYVALAAALLQEGHEVVLAGGPDDQWAVPHFKHLGATNVIGRLSLLEMLSLLDSADVTVTHDTGPLHLAGLTSTAIVTIFGPTDPRGRLPQRENCLAIWGGEGFACRPCYDGRDYAPCKHNGCMSQVSPVMVAGHVDRLLRTIAEGQPQLPRIIAPEHPRVSGDSDLVRVSA